MNGRRQSGLVCLIIALFRMDDLHLSIPFFVGAYYPPPLKIICAQFLVAKAMRSILLMDPADYLVLLSPRYFAVLGVPWPQGCIGRYY